MKYIIIAAAIVIFAGCEGGKTEHAYRPFVFGDVQRGEHIFSQRGCGACHHLDDAREARGRVGPPLDGFVHRTFIAGRMPNTPENLVRWLLNPPGVDPQTAMPNLGLNLQEARDLAAFLYEQD